MEMDVSISKTSTIEPLKTISAGSYANSGNNNNYNSNYNNNNSHANSIHHNATRPATSSPISLSLSAAASASTPIPQKQQSNVCCGLLSFLFCIRQRNTAKTASSSTDYNNFATGSDAACISTQPQAARTTTPTTTSCCLMKPQQRRTPQEIYFESRGKSCKKLLKFNGNSNKILLYPEEGWARTASSSYWTITPCWWQPNHCRIEEISGTQRQVTKAKMFALEQQGSLLIAGHFDNKQKGKYKNTNQNPTNHNQNYNNTNRIRESCRNSATSLTPDEFKLYLSSNVSMEDYNMGYCLTGFVERRCQQTNAFQMTHFAVIKRQWPSIISSSSSRGSRLTKST